MNFKKQLIEAYKAGIRKALSLTNERRDSWLYGPTFDGVHFKIAMLNDCQPIDHFDGISNFDELEDKVFQWAGIDRLWSDENKAVLDEVFGKEAYKLTSTFHDLKDSYNYFLERGGMEKNGPNDHSFSDLCADLAQCFVALNWAEPRIEHSNLPPDKKKRLHRIYLAIRRAYNHIGYEVKYAGYRDTPNWR